jgi:nucleotide-binding universal stress UspA family protein
LKAEEGTLVKVLIGIDSSPSSERVLEAALARPWPPETTFCVLNIVDLQGFSRLPALIEEARREGEHLVDAGAKRFCGSGHQAFTKLLLGYPRREISDYAKEWGADLIMVGSHGHNAIGRFLLGSVAQGALRAAPCSVEIVRTVGKTPSDHALKVLLATDGSDCSVGAVHAVANGPWPEGTIFKILSVEELMVVGNQMEASSLSAVYPASLLEELIAEAHNRAASAVGTAKAILLAAGRNVLEAPSTPVGEPRAVILDTAKAWGADLIVLGSHGRRGLDRFLLGSVSEAVAIHANCSVQVVRACPQTKGESRAAS